MRRWPLRAEASIAMDGDTVALTLMAFLVLAAIAVCASPPDLVEEAFTTYD